MKASRPAISVRTPLLTKTHGAHPGKASVLDPRLGRDDADRIGAVRPLHADRDLPRRPRPRRVRLRRIQEESPLADRQSRAASLARERHVNERNTRLVHERWQDAIDRFARHRRDRRPEILRPSMGSRAREGTAVATVNSGARRSIRGHMG
jgi:hypothetical protein